MSTQGASSSFSRPSTLPWKNDVFLNFSGEDTRYKFAHTLYSALTEKEIMVFMDNKLERGRDIESELLEKIEASRFSIVVFSRNYASSKWCLNELDKIVECMDEKGQVVMPIFYDVDPSHVSNQTGSYKEAFDKHDKDFKENKEMVHRWRTAITRVANVSGWDIRNRPEADAIKEIVKVIKRQRETGVTKGLVGIYSRIVELESYLGEVQNDVRIVGIYGESGIGKTTIARVAYDKLSGNFTHKCFLANVKEIYKKHGLLPLQNQLLSAVLKIGNINVSDVHTGMPMIVEKLQHKKVLIVLDDVDEFLLPELVGNREFGFGSIIIVTTTVKESLKSFKEEETCEAKRLLVNEALELFSWKAFKSEHPPEDYKVMSTDIVKCARYLPLVIEVLGSFFHNRRGPDWGKFLKGLEGIANRPVSDILLLGFKGLEDMESNIFLDIACFFKGSDIDHATKILDSCYFNADTGTEDVIEALIDKSLIKVSENKLWIHDMLQIMGQERCGLHKEPGKRSRLWAYEDVNSVLTKNTGTEAVKSIVLDLPGEKKVHWNADGFSRLCGLRMLKLYNVQLSEGPNCLPNELRFLEWQGYPSQSLPSSFEPHQLSELNMCYSRIEQLWEREIDLPKLKSINLSHSKNLTKTPDFTRIPNLEKLLLEGCTRLHKVDPSIGLLKKLIYLNLRDCKSLRSLARKIEMESLQELILSGCSKLGKFPEISGKMEHLSKLYLDETAIEGLPSSIGLLTGLTWLSLRDCKNLASLPTSINDLKSLEGDTSGCSKLSVEEPPNIPHVILF